jgi:hypothetical protein
MPSIQGALDRTHIAISKPSAFPEDYWYYKTGAYSMVAQAMVDVKKLYTNIYVGLPGSVNDQRVLRRLGLWQEVVHRGLMSADSGYQDGIPSYLLGDKGRVVTQTFSDGRSDDGRGGVRDLDAL